MDIKWASCYFLAGSKPVIIANRTYQYFLHHFPFTEDQCIVNIPLVKTKTRLKEIRAHLYLIKREIIEYERSTKADKNQNRSD